MQEDDRIQLLEDGICHFGVARNFIHLVNSSSAQYCMFCDQDDIWLPNKIEEMLGEIKRYSQDIPQVVYSNAYLWTSQKGIISDKNTLTYPTTLRQTLFLNTGIQGAAAIFNRKMCDRIGEELCFYAMHDHVLLLAGICFGEVHYLHKSLMYYRQHENNLTGNAPGSKRKKLKLMWQNRNVPLVSREHYNGLKTFYEHFKESVLADDRQVIEIFLSLSDKNFLVRLWRIVQYRFKLFDSTLLLIIKMCIRRYI
jgi:rhamnosyltransferase